MQYSYIPAHKESENDAIAALIRNPVSYGETARFQRKLVAQAIRADRAANKPDQAKWFLCHCYFIGMPGKA